MKTFWLTGADRVDPIYREWLDLRFRVLREPLGLSYSEADLEAERDDRSLVLLDRGKVIAGLLLRELKDSGPVWKIRQVAVEPARQGYGLGRTLMETVAREARGGGIRMLVLHSRETVCGFYEKLGYEVEGESFSEIGIPHRRMRLAL